MKNTSFTFLSQVNRHLLVAFLFPLDRWLVEYYGFGGIGHPWGWDDCDAQDGGKGEEIYQIQQVKVQGT